MKLNAILSIAFLLVMLTNYSQVISPNTNIIENDTIWPASNEAINLSNNIVNDLDACVDLLQSKDSTITEYEKTTKEASVIIVEQEQQISNLLNQVNLTDEMLQACDKAEKKKDRKIKFLKFTRNVLIAIVAIETCYIGIKTVFLNDN